MKRTDRQTDSRILVYHNTSRLKDGRIKIMSTIVIFASCVVQFQNNKYICVQQDFPQYFSYIMACIFIGGGLNKNTWKKLQIYHKSQNSFTPKVWVPINQSNPVTLLSQGLDFQCHGNFYIQYDLMVRGDCSFCSILVELLTITV